MKKKWMCILAVLLCGSFCAGMPVHAENRENDQTVEKKADLQTMAGQYREPGSTLATPYWSEAVKCHVYAEGNGNTKVIYSVLSGTKQSMVIDTFSADGNRKSHKSISVPGESWGGTVYQGPDSCYYITTGNGSDAAFYIQKYDQEWNLKGTASVSGDESYTSQAFRAGNSSMCMVDKYLVVHAARRRKDGHQSNTTFVIDTETMSPTYITGQFGFDHVSHSFNQFIKSNGNEIIMVDHGDAHPRSIFLQAYDASVTEGKGLYFRRLKDLSLMEINGEIGDNYTGVTVGGFELGKNHHIIAGAAIPHDKIKSKEEFENYNYGSVENLYVILAAKDFSSSSIKWLTSYAQDSKLAVDNVKIIKIHDDRFALLYGLRKVEDDESVKTCCKILDSNGNVLQSAALDRPFYCTSEPSIRSDELVWCHYVESELGNFLVQNQWNIKTGKFSVKNLNIGVKNAVSKISGSGNLKWKGKKNEERTVRIEVHSPVFKEDFPTAPVVWKSSNPSVLEIQGEESILSYFVYNESYKTAETTIKIKAAGTATITAEAGDQKCSMKIKVSISKPKVKKITISGKKTVKAGKSFQLKAKVVADKGANKKLTWTSSNKKYARVNSKGKVKTYKKGKGKKVKITAKAKDGSGKKKTVTITIK